MIDQAPDGGRCAPFPFCFKIFLDDIQIIAGSEAGVYSFIVTMFYW